ncbi:MAG: tetratricopeptide repeat protein [Aquabacterium sp.]|nr:tetratricopeptide repeat protein [Aquabacterium sp.]
MPRLHRFEQVISTKRSATSPNSDTTESGLPQLYRPVNRNRWMMAAAMSFALSSVNLAEAAASTSVDKPAIQNSSIDGALFYQILVAEIQANAGDAGSAYQIYLEAARRQQNGLLYQRAVEIALKNRAGEQALAAAKAWRQALPNSKEAAEFTTQILLALGRSTDLAAPLRSLIQLTPAPQQPQAISTLVRTTARIADKKAAAQVIDEATQPWRHPPLELSEAWVVSSEAWMQAKDGSTALTSLKRAFRINPIHQGAGLLAIDLMTLAPQSEDLVKQQLTHPDAPELVRLTYARKLAGARRFTESAAQLETLLKAQPEQTGTWLTLAAVRLELKQSEAAEVALRPVLALEKKGPTSATNEPGTRTAAESNDLTQAYLLMSQIAEQRQQLALAGTWLERADPKHEKLAIQGQRARLLFRQGKLNDARKLIRELPETEPRDAITKYQAEAQLLRDANQLEDAYKVLAEASKRFPEDSDIMYDQAMLGEKLLKFEAMEGLLRKVIELSPDNPNAFNALGYSFADRKIHLSEARALITKALELRPGDPFITDSLGWLEFRAGNLAEATRLLREAHEARPDAEIAAHLGEVLWSQGKQDEARKIWLDTLKSEGDNETLKETLKRFHVKP